MLCICVYATDLLIFILIFCGLFVSFRRDHCAVIWTLFTEKTNGLSARQNRVRFNVGVMPEIEFLCAHFICTVSYFHIFIHFFAHSQTHQIYDLVSLDHISCTNILFIHSDFRHTYTHLHTLTKLYVARNPECGIFNFESQRATREPCCIGVCARRYKFTCCLAVVHFSQNAAYFLVVVAVDGTSFLTFYLQSRENNRSKTCIHYS